MSNHEAPALMDIADLDLDAFAELDEVLAADIRYLDEDGWLSAEDAAIDLYADEDFFWGTDVINEG